MTTPLHAEIFDLMASLLELQPDMRVGQLICNAVMYSNLGDYIPSVGNIDDEVLVGALRTHLRGVEKYRAEALEPSQELQPAFA